MLAAFLLSNFSQSRLFTRELIINRYGIAHWLSLAQVS